MRLVLLGSLDLHGPPPEYLVFLLIELGGSGLGGVTLRLGTAASLRGMVKHIKNIGALLLAGASAYALSFASDLLFGRLFGLFPNTVWLPIGTWSAIFLILFFAAASLSLARWISFGFFGGVALFGAIVGSHPHSYLVAAVLLVIACWRWVTRKTVTIVPAAT